MYGGWWGVFTVSRISEWLSSPRFNPQRRAPWNSPEGPSGSHCLETLFLTSLAFGFSPTLPVFFFPVKRKDTRDHFGFENDHVLDFASRAVF